MMWVMVESLNLDVDRTLFLEVKISILRHEIMKLDKLFKNNGYRALNGNISLIT